MDWGEPCQTRAQAAIRQARTSLTCQSRDDDSSLPIEIPSSWAWPPAVAVECMRPVSERSEPRCMKPGGSACRTQGRQARTTRRLGGTAYLHGADGRAGRWRRSIRLLRLFSSIVLTLSAGYFGQFIVILGNGSECHDLCFSKGARGRRLVTVTEYYLTPNALAHPALVLLFFFFFGRVFHALGLVDWLGSPILKVSRRKHNAAAL